MIIFDGDIIVLIINYSDCNNVKNWNFKMSTAF